MRAPARRPPTCSFLACPSAPPTPFPSPLDSSQSSLNASDYDVSRALDADAVREEHEDPAARHVDHEPAAFRSPAWDGVQGVQHQQPPSHGVRNAAADAAAEGHHDNMDDGSSDDGAAVRLEDVRSRQPRTPIEFPASDAEDPLQEEWVCRCLSGLTSSVPSVASWASKGSN